MTDSLVFDDLMMLDGADLQAVFDQLTRDEVVAALWGCAPSLRGQLLRKLSHRAAQPIHQAIASTTHLSFEQVLGAQQKAIAATCQLSRNGQIAFDIPEDMVA